MSHWLGVAGAHCSALAGSPATAGMLVSAPGAWCGKRNNIPGECWLPHFQPQLEDSRGHGQGPGCPGPCPSGIACPLSGMAFQPMQEQLWDFLTSRVWRCSRTGLVLSVAQAPGVRPASAPLRVHTIVGKLCHVLQLLPGHSGLPSSSLGSEMGQESLWMRQRYEDPRPEGCFSGAPCRTVQHQAPRTGVLQPVGTVPPRRTGLPRDGLLTSVSTVGGCGLFTCGPVGHLLLLT